MGVEFGPDGSLFIVDNQGWTGNPESVNQGRILKVSFNADGKINSAHDAPQTMAWLPLDTEAPAQDTNPGSTTAAAAATPAPEAGTYTVKSGDCLWNIAARELGSGNRWGEIYALNKAVIKNPNRIYTGQVLTMPAK